jgi:predicted Zn-dependent protease
MYRKRFKHLILVLWLVSALSIPAMGQQTVDLNEMRVKVQTRAREMTIGRQAARRFERRAKLVKDATVVEYVDRIAQNVARNSDCAVPVTIKIVDSNEINAFSFPGGFLYINSGLILGIDEEAELAAVIAHEIAHVVARDGMKDSSYLGTGTSANRVLIPGSVGNSGTELDGFLIPMKFAASTRETDADARGIQYLQNAGYDPMALVTFLQKMRPKEESDVDRLFAMFQTHPPTAERIRLAQERIGNVPPANHTSPETAAEFQKIKAIILQTSN